MEPELVVRKIEELNFGQFSHRVGNSTGKIGFGCNEEDKKTDSKEPVDW